MAPAQARCIEYGDTCPTNDQAKAAFKAADARARSFEYLRRVHVMDLNEPHGFDGGPLAEFLGRPGALRNKVLPHATKADVLSSGACRSDPLKNRPRADGSLRPARHRE